MRRIAAWVRSRRTLVSAIAVAVLVSIPVSIAIVHRGFPVTDVDLTAQNVWVTNGKQLLGGRLNHQIDELDAKVNGASSHLDVLQDAGQTLLADTSQGTVQVIDPAFVSLTQKITVPVGAELGYGANSLAILAPDGRLWVVDTSEHLVFDASKTTPVAKLGPGSHVVVSKSGKVFAASRSKHALYTVDHPGAASSSKGFPVPKSFQLSAVGDHPVLLDPAARTLVREDGSATRLDAKPLRLQQPGPDDDDALVATGSGLLEVPLGGGDPIAIGADISRPVTTASATSAPVYLNGCAYGAWAGAQRYLYACDGKRPITQDIEQATVQSRLEFRVNHGVIALNDLQNGNAWVVSSNMRLVSNWTQVNPEDITKDGDTGKERPVKQSFEDAVANRTKTNHPPIATNDGFGVRPDRTTVLPVLDNDTDEDGDVLAITKVDDIPEGLGRIDVIEGGRALQYTPPTQDVTTVSFRYTITDGRDAYASAQVDVTLRPLSQNAAPVAKRTSSTEVEVGQSIQYDVLNDWIDPDGDDIYLVGASPTTPDQVQFTPDGRITFTSKTGQTGSKQVAFTVSDGHATATGSLEVDVKPADSLDPVAVPDFATATSASPVVIHPLENDQSPSGAPLSLVDAKVETGGAASVSADPDKAAITFQANSAGPYYLVYTLGAGSHTTQGIVLVDVSEPSSSDAPPIAVKDVAYVRPGEPTSVDVLANDVSPSGRVLALQSVEGGPDTSALNVEVLANSVVRVTAPGVLGSQVQLTYVVSDGVHTATAGITVVPIPPLVNHQPPVAVDDAVTVRAGDIATVHVLDNDYSPDNEPITLDAELADSSQAGEGATVFVSGSFVRYQAPRTPGTYSVAYGITDKFGQRANATVTFSVTAPGKDRAPEPQELTARAFAGASVEIVVPLDAVDPDGDSVYLDGIQSAPTLGRVTATTPTSLTYEAYPTSAGTDSFTYQVEDTAGKTATGTVRVGVIPRPTTVRPPIAVDDRVQVKPGKTAAVPVLLNDSDPNGYTISLKPKLPEVQAPLKAVVSGSTVLVTAPENEGAYVVRYQITNGQGGSATAFIQVLVTNDAKPERPTAVDHVVDVQQLTDKPTVDVHVLDGALNPSGRTSDLTIALTGPYAHAGTVKPDGTVTVTPGDERMAITYSLTDESTGLSGDAFIVVPPKPGSQTAPPRIKPGLGEQIVQMNGSKQFALSDVIDVPSGRPARLVDAGSTHATNAVGAAYVNPQALQFSAAKDYRGPAAITFAVDDGRDPGMTEDRVTVLTLPITVGSPDQSDVPPTFTPPSLQIEAGEAAQTIDLRDSTYHPNPAILAQVSYGGMTSSNPSVQASLSGSSLSVSAPFGVQPGTTARISFTLSYKDFHIPGSVDVRVVSSSRPLATQKNPPQTIDFKRGSAGGTLSSAVSSDYWINPFPDHPLTIVDAKVANAPKGVSVSYTASSITVQASTAADTGTVSVVYTVEDATKDPQRRVTGQLSATIHDVPDAPPAPASVAATDAQATMRIAAPASDHGKPVRSYEIRSVPATTTGTQTAPGVYTARGLTNGTTYTFQVRAINADGPSEWSAASADVTPYGTPSPPTNPKLTNKGGDAPTTLKMTWDAPTNRGGGTMQYSYNFNGEGWSAWQAGTSASKSDVGKGTYSFQVKARVQQKPTLESTAASSGQVTVKDPPPPPASVALSRGPYVTSSTCVSGCYGYDIDMSNFDANKTYTATLHCSFGDLSAHPSITTNGNGNAHYSTGTTSYCGGDAWVTINPGGVTSPKENFRP